MTSHADLAHLQDNALITGVAGGALYTFGLSLHFMSHDIRDNTKIDLESRSKHTQVYMLGSFFIVAGVILLTVAASCWRDEGREVIGGNTSRVVTQVREMQSQPDVNEPAILAGIGAGFILIGGFVASKDFHISKRFEKYSSLVHGLGWAMLGAAGAMKTKSIDSVNGTKLAMTLPGVALIAIGAHILPWQAHHGYTSGPALPLIATGATLFTIGNSWNIYHSS